MPYSCGYDFHGYTLLELCGSGGFGEVYTCQDMTGKILAIKIISKTKMGGLWKRELHGLVNYRQISSDSPHLLKIHHVDSDDEFFYYTMDAADPLPGQNKYQPDTLAARIEKAPVPPNRIFEIAKHILLGLKDIHSFGMSHRDIKPGNIIFVKGLPQIGDIGLTTSDLSIMTSLAGTMEFIPPEIRKTPGSTDVDFKKNDLYAMGMLLYCMLSGTNPDRFPSLPDSLPNIPEVRALNKIICRACSNDPFKRINDTEEFLHLLDAATKQTDRTIRWKDRFKTVSGELSLTLNALFLRFQNWKKKNPEWMWFFRILFLLLFFSVGYILAITIYGKQYIVVDNKGHKLKPEFDSTRLSINIPIDWNLKPFDSPNQNYAQNERLLLLGTGARIALGTKAYIQIRLHVEPLVSDWNSNREWMDFLAKKLDCPADSGDTFSPIQHSVINHLQLITCEATDEKTKGRFFFCYINCKDKIAEIELFSPKTSYEKNRGELMQILNSIGIIR